jgi:hypothetical protein
MPSIPELVQSARFIFSGTVVGRGKSTVPAVPHDQKLVTARLDRGIRIDPVLGELRGKEITVAAKAPEAFSPGQRFVFFTNSWVHGRGIAVREVSHLDIGAEDAVSAEVAELPNKHLQERLRTAALVAAGEIVSIDPPLPTFDRHAALWAAAHLRIERILRGPHRDQVILYFPTALWPPWNTMPRFTQNQRGIFILHSATRENTHGDPTLPPDSFVALDPADFHDESQWAAIEQILNSIQ